jgi:hypothetical protein
MSKILDFYQSNKRHIIIIGIVILAFLLVLDYNSRITSLVLVTSQRDQIQTEVGGLKLTDQYLGTQIAHATSDAGVAEWARQNNLFQQGDTRIIVLPPEDALPTPTPIMIPTQEPLSSWQIWLQLLFGD